MDDVKDNFIVYGYSLLFFYFFLVMIINFPDMVRDWLDWLNHKDAQLLKDLKDLKD
jgi:hypothetical protein